MSDKESWGGLKECNINLNFEKFNPIRGSAITFELEYGKKPKPYFRIKCDKDIVGKTLIKKDWKLVPFLMIFFM